MNILITGGNGFIGSRLVPKLLEKKHKVTILKRKKSDLSSLEKILNKVNLYNFNDEKTYEKLFSKEKIDIVVHLAGQYLKEEPNSKEAEEITNFNVIQSALLLKAAIKHNVKGFINTGTFFEFKPSHKKLTEKSEKLPFNFYAASKMAFEDILKYYARQGKIKAMTLRLFSPYGEGQDYKVIALVINSFIKNKKLNLTKGDQKLSFTYVGDIVEAYLKAIEFVTSKKYKQYEDFNIGSTKSYSLYKIVSKIKKLSKKDAPLKFGVVPYFEHDFMQVICDSTKAQKILKWKAATSIEKGLRKTYKYFLLR